LTERIEKKIVCASVSHCCSLGPVILLDTPQAAPGCIVGAHMKQQQHRVWTVQGLVALGDVPDTSR